MGDLTFEPLIPGSLWLVLALAGGALLAWYAMRRPEAISSRRWMAILAFMSLALVLVLGLLLNPSWSRELPPPAGKPVLTVLVDVSGSMATPDAVGGSTRFVAAATDASKLFSGLSDRFDVRILAFDQTLRMIDPAALSSAVPNGPGTDLSIAVTGALSEEHSPGQAIVLLSDGIDNAGGGVSPILTAVRTAKALAAPIYTKTFGGEVKTIDLAVEIRSPQDMAVVSQKVAITARVTHIGVATGKTIVTLWHDGKEVARRDAILDPDGPVDVNFLVSQDKIGIYPYEVHVETLPGEISQANNSASYVLRVVDEPIRVLVLEGKPYWDSKFFTRTLMADPAIALDCVVRLSDNRLLHRTLSHQHSSATTRATAATEPVDDSNGDRVETWKIDTEPSQVLGSPDKLRGYQIIVIGRDAEPFLDDHAVENLQNWVSQQGGSLLCYRGSPTSIVNQRLAKLMPVRWASGAPSRFRVALTEQGKELNWFGNTSATGDALPLLPSLAASSVIDLSKPLAVILAQTVAGNTASSPAVIYQPYGNGRVVDVEGAGMWRWAFLAPEYQSQDPSYAALWHSMMRWLTSGQGLTPGQIFSLRTDKVRFSSDEPATATLLARADIGRDKLPVVSLATDGSKEVKSFIPLPLGDEAGVFRVNFSELPEGRYTAKLSDSKPNDPSEEIIFDVRKYDQETLDLQSRPDLMARIATDSGGAVLFQNPAEEVGDQFAQHLGARHASALREDNRLGSLVGAYRGHRIVERIVGRASSRRSGMTNISTRLSKTRPADAIKPLAETLDSLRRRISLVGASAAFAWGAVAVLVILLAFVWVDLILELPGGIRLACGIGALLAAAVIAARLIVRSRDGGSSLNIARRLDDVAGTHGQVLAGVDLASSGPFNSPLTAGLAHLAIYQAFEITRRVDHSLVIRGRPLYRPTVLLGCALLLLGILAISSPRLISTEWARFTDPFGDHPPYSSLTFDVDPGDARVVYGGAIDIHATVRGGVADRMELVLSDAGASAEPLPMFPEENGKWRTTVVNVTTPQKYVLRAGQARSRQYSLDVVTVPQLTEVSCRIQLPAYTSRSPYVGPIPQNGLAGLPGTIIELHAKSNRPLSLGRIAFSFAVNPTTAPASGMNNDVVMTPIAPGSNEVVGRFQIQSTGKLTLGVTDVAGQASTDKLSTSITLLTDERPFIRMIEPKANSFATPDATMKVVALAEDDYGISKISIFRGLNESRPRPTDIPVPLPPPTQFPATMDLHLYDYGLQPGDVIQLFARAEDNDPAGPKGAESSIVTIRVISQKEMDQLMVAREGIEALQSKYSAAERRLEAIDSQLDKLEKELGKLDPNSKAAEALRQKIADLSDQLAKAAADIDKLADHEMPFDIDHALTGQLKDLAKTLKDAADDAKSAADAGLGAAGALDKVQKLRKKLGIKRDEFHQNTNEPLDHLAKIFPLIEDEARFLDLYARQKDLADRLAAVQTQSGKDDPQVKAHMRDLEDEQRGLRDDLRQLLDDIDNHVAQLPEDKRLDGLRDTATKFSAAVRASPAGGQMQDAESALEEFTGTAAMMNAQAAADTLDKFISRCQGMEKQGEECLKFQPKLSAALGNTVGQLLGSMSLSSGLAGGGTGGYSAMRNSLENVGLYGTLPVRGEESQGGGGDAKHGVASSANGSNDGNNNPDHGPNGSKQQASGQSDTPVPTQYKKRVGDYFQRVSDELSD